VLYENAGVRSSFLRPESNYLASAQAAAIVTVSTALDSNNERLVLALRSRSGISDRELSNQTVYGLYAAVKENRKNIKKTLRGIGGRATAPHYERVA
jgi:hypothetical protein